MFQRFFNWRSFFYLLALAIVAGTVYYTRYVAQKIELEERQRVEEWIHANKTLQAAKDQSAISLANMVIVHNEDMPLIATDEKGEILDFRNLDSNAIARDSNYVKEMLKELGAARPPIDWVINDSPLVVYKVYYGDTKLLNEVRYYPLVQLLVVSIFIFLLLALISTRNKSAQNQVWAGMAKETAHQLGTPITSLQGWLAVLKEEHPNADLLKELEKDIDRLKLVSDRFSKIGSSPQLELTNLVELASEMIEYMKRRASGKVRFEMVVTAEKLEVLASATLINWVLENLLKNALDAMEGAGLIAVKLYQNQNEVWVDVEDNGKGISAARLQKVFEPGYTTKKRGWGLGLSLSKRIVEQYHKGQLFVKQSEPGQGTIFRMVLPRPNRHV